MLSCYLKASCFRPKPFQKHQQPPMEKKVFVTIPHRSYQKLNKTRTKLSLEKHIKKNTKNIDFLTALASQTLPKTSPKPSQIEPKRALGRLLDPLGPSWQQSLEKRRLKVPQETPRRSQTSPKTVPKPFQNRLKNACKKYMVSGIVFFVIFLTFGF